MFCAVFEMPDETLRIVHPTREKRLEDETDEEYVNWMAVHAKRAQPDLRGRPFVVVDAADLPADREHRSHWRLRDGKVVVEIPDEERAA